MHHKSNTIQLSRPQTSFEGTLYLILPLPFAFVTGSYLGTNSYGKTREGDSSCLFLASNLAKSKQYYWQLPKYTLEFNAPKKEGSYSNYIHFQGVSFREGGHDHYPKFFAQPTNCPLVSKSLLMFQAEGIEAANLLQKISAEHVLTLVRISVSRPFKI